MQWIQQLFSFLFPQFCVGCRSMGERLCSSCLHSIPIHSDPFVKEPGWALDGLFVVAPYTKKSLLQTCIKTMKYRHSPNLANQLGEWMGLRFPLAQFRDFILVPVPLHPKRKKERGYNQAHCLAEGVATVLSLPIEELLQRKFYTLPQAQLSREDRLKNLLNSFSLSQNSNTLNKKIILVDDVCSTGATLNECAKVLKSTDAKTVWGLVLARGA